MHADPVFITVEGIDGTGKGTLIEGLKRELAAKGLLDRFQFTAEPSDSGPGRLIKSGYAKQATDHLADAFLFMADRAEHARWIRHELHAGYSIVCDRYHDSTVAYQAVELRGHFPPEHMKGAMDWLDDLSRFFMASPDLTILLDADPELTLERVRGRGGTTRFEKLDYLKTVRDNFLYLAKKHPDRIRVVNAARSPDAVLSDAAGYVFARLDAK